MAEAVLNGDEEMVDDGFLDVVDLEDGELDEVYFSDDDDDEEPAPAPLVYGAEAVAPPRDIVIHRFPASYEERRAGIPHCDTIDNCPKEEGKSL